MGVTSTEAVSVTASVTMSVASTVSVIVTVVDLLGLHKPRPVAVLVPWTVMKSVVVVVVVCWISGITVAVTVLRM